MSPSSRDKRIYIPTLNALFKGVLREKELKGEYLGSIAPYGYKKSTLYKNKLEIDKNVAYVIEKIFDLYLRGNGLQRMYHSIKIRSFKSCSVKSHHLYIHR